MSSSSMGRFSEIGITTVRAWLDKISTVSPDGTTVWAQNLDGFWQQFSSGNAAFVVANTTWTANQDKIFVVTTINASSSYVALITGLGASTQWSMGDQFAILPKPQAYICVNSESIKETANWDTTECLQAWEPTYHSVLTVDTGGDLGVFVGSESIVLDYILSATMGQTTHNAGINGNSKHVHTPGSTIPGLTVYVMRGNHVELVAYGGLSVDNLVIDQPAGGASTARVALTGGFGIQEIGGAGKTFSTGTGNFWNPPSPTPDIKRMGFRHLIVSTSTSYGGTYVPKTYAESGQITISRNPVTERRLGDPFIYDAQSAKFVATGNVVQWFESQADDD